MKPAAKSTVERMREYRERQRQNGVKSRSFMMSDEDYCSVKDYADQYGVDLNGALNELLRNSINVVTSNEANSELVQLKDDVKYWREESLKQEGFYADASRELIELKAKLEDRYTKPQNAYCQHVTSHGSLCKAKATHAIDLGGFTVWACGKHNKAT